MRGGMAAVTMCTYATTNKKSSIDLSAVTKSLSGRNCSFNLIQRHAGLMNREDEKSDTYGVVRVQCSNAR